jgi:Flp pilus assembly protein TadD
MFEAQSLRRLGRTGESLAVNREAVRRAELVVELNPLNSRALSLGAGALCNDGQGERALEWSHRAEALNPHDMTVIMCGALVRAQLGLKDEALDLLERVLNKGWGKKGWIDNDPDYDTLREEPRFKAMMARLLQ